MDPELSEHARQALASIQQGNRSVIDYIAEFDKTFLEAQSSDLPDWQKVNSVRNGLNRKKGRLLVGTIQPKEYGPWCAHVKSLEREDAAEAMRSNSYGRNNRLTPTPQSGQPQPTAASRAFPPVETPPAPEAEMTLGAAGQRRRAAWVTPEERQNRFLAGLCRRCGGPDHILRTCPYLPARRPTPAVQQIHPGPLLEPIPSDEGHHEPEK